VDKKLFAQAVGKFSVGVLAVFALVFLPAGTLDWWNGWLLMGLLFVPMFCAGLVMLAKNPQLLRKRLQNKEEQTEQKLVILLSGLMFLGGFVAAGLDRRFGWSQLPDWLVYLASALFLIAYLLYAQVLRENTYLSRTVEVQQDQKVIDTGLYGIVRHPMYSATILLFLSMPLILGSWPAFVIFLAYPAIIVKRLKNEEQVLEEGLEGYAEYRKKVVWRLIPFVW